MRNTMQWVRIGDEFVNLGRLRRVVFRRCPGTGSLLAYIDPPPCREDELPSEDPTFWDADAEALRAAFGQVSNR